MENAPLIPSLLEEFLSPSFGTAFLHPLIPDNATSTDPSLDLHLHQGLLCNSRHNHLHFRRCYLLRYRFAKSGAAVIIKLYRFAPLKVKTRLLFS